MLLLGRNPKTLSPSPDKTGLGLVSPPPSYGRATLHFFSSTPPTPGLRQKKFLYLLSVFSKKRVFSFHIALAVGGYYWLCICYSPKPFNRERGAEGINTNPFPSPCLLGTYFSKPERKKSQVVLVAPKLLDFFPPRHIMAYMAIMNLLQGKFTGRLGEVVGQSWKDKNVIRSNSFGKAPPTKAQTLNVRAFEALNRISSAYAKIGWEYFSLSDKKVLKHNAVASWLKPVIKNHLFEPWNMAELIEPSGELVGAGLYTDTATGLGVAGFASMTGYTPTPGHRQFSLVCDNSGKVLMADIRKPSFEPLPLKAFFLPDLKYFLLVFLARPTEAGYTLFSFSCREGVGMQYSLDEQLTGNFWLDGSPIYQRTFKITYTSPGNLDLSKSQDFNIMPMSGVKTFLGFDSSTSFHIEARGFFLPLPLSYNSFTDNLSRSLGSQSFSLQSTEDASFIRLAIKNVRLNTVGLHTFYITLLYTKP